MQQVDTLIHAEWVLPVAPNNTLLNHHSVATKGNKIIELLPTTEAKLKYTAQHEFERPQHVLMPGLVNAHTHLPMNLFKGLAEDLALMDWLNNHIWPAEAATLNEQSVQVGSELALTEMIRGGTTCINDHYFYPRPIANAMIKHGMRGRVGLWLGSVATAWAQTEEAYYQKALKMLDEGTSSSRIEWSIAPHAPYTVSDDLFIKIKELSNNFNIPVHMHVHETKAEIEGSLTQYGKRPLQRLDELGLLNDKLIAVHMVWINEEEIELTAKKGVQVIHCPESNMKVASGFAPIKQFRDAGVNVGIGTDGAASNNDLDMLGEMRTAGFIAKGYTKDPMALPASQILHMATLGGAMAMGMADQIGSIETGKCADLISINLDHEFTQPVYNPLSQLIYAASRNQVSEVWVDGELLLQEGRFTRTEPQAVIEAVKPWQEKIRQYQHSA